MPQNQNLAQELERLQREFEQQNPDLAEAMKVMNISLTEYLTALSYMRQGGQFGTASDFSIPLARSEQTTFVA